MMVSWQVVVAVVVETVGEPFARSAVSRGRETAGQGVIGARLQWW